jgi:hypothetical protein
MNNIIYKHDTIKIIMGFGEMVKASTKQSGNRATGFKDIVLSIITSFYPEPKPMPYPQNTNIYILVG